MANTDAKRLVSDVDKDLQSFYDRSSIFVGNKYEVQLRGSYVNKALALLESYARDEKESGDSVKLNVAKLNRWKAIHLNTSIPNTVEFKWACQSINLPTTKLKIEDNSKTTMDPWKTINYGLVTDYNRQSSISMKILEDEDYMWYHFFNALNNCFFNTKESLTPDDSVRKLQMIVRVYQFNYEVTKGSEGTYGGNPSHAEVALFEYNGIVLTSMGNALNYMHDVEQPLVHDVTFESPNPFQKPFKHQTDDLADKSSDSANLVEKTSKDDEKLTTTEYNVDMFENYSPIRTSYNMYESNWTSGKGNTRNIGLYNPDTSQDVPT